MVKEINMKITLKGEDNIGEDDSMFIEDESLDNDNYISLNFETKRALAMGDHQRFYLRLDELMAACIAFQQKRTNRLVEEDLRK